MTHKQQDALPYGYEIVLYYSPTEVFAPLKDIHVDTYNRMTEKINQERHERTREQRLNQRHAFFVMLQDVYRKAYQKSLS